MPYIILGTRLWGIPLTGNGPSSDATPTIPMNAPEHVRATLVGYNSHNVMVFCNVKGPKIRK